MLFSDQKRQQWKHDFWILLLFTQFLIYLVLVYVFKYVNSIELTYTVFTKNGECNYEKLFAYIFWEVLTQQQEKYLNLVYLSCLIFITVFFQNSIACSLFPVLILSLLLLVTEMFSFSLLSHSLLHAFSLKPLLFCLAYDGLPLKSILCYCVLT